MRAPAQAISHPIDTSAARSMASPLTTLALAALAAAGVLLPWADGANWSKRGWSYEHGLVALVAAAGAAIVCALRAFGNSDSRGYLLLGLLCAFIGLGATAWFYVRVIGTTDPATHRLLISWLRLPRVAGGVGLYLSMAGFIGQIVALLWRFDHGVRNFVRSIMGSPWTTSAFIALAAVGVLLPWEWSPLRTKPGWTFNEGLVALVAAAEAGIVCALRASGQVRAAPYVLLGLLCAFAGLGACVWFYADLRGGVEPSGYPILVTWLNAPRTGVAEKTYVSAAGFIGQIAVLLWQTWLIPGYGDLSLRLSWPRTRATQAE